MCTSTKAVRTRSFIFPFTPRPWIGMEGGEHFEKHPPANGKSTEPGRPVVRALFGKAFQERIGCFTFAFFPIEDAADIHVPHDINGRTAAVEEPIHRQQERDI